MISNEMANKINHQINREIYSAYLYLSMAAYSYSVGLPGFANWFNVQMQEEMYHAKRFYDYMNQQGQKVILEAIEAPENDFASAVGLFGKTLSHEKIVTSLIHGITALARKENDFATEAFMQWFITEQVEEESNAMEILQKLNMVGGKGEALFLIDKELATRVFVLPSWAANPAN